MGNIMDKARLAISRMIASGDKVLVAVSGGPDSVCLLYLLQEMQEKFRFGLSIAHIDHMARGAESAEDSRFVDELGKKLGLETFIERVDVLKEKETLKTSFQEAGRILRYRFLESTLKRIGGNKLALGHTADDQVETLLINLLRGSGLKGLAGMPETRGVVVRPLIDCGRAEVEAYLAGENLDFRVDATNAGDAYLRNRIRHELLPVLKTFNQQIASNLQETAKIIRDDDQCLTDQARSLYLEMAAPLAGGYGVELDRVKFNQQPSAYQKRLVRQAIYSTKGDLRRISSKHIQTILDLFDDSRVGKRIHLPGQLIAVSGRRGVEFQKCRESRALGGSNGKRPLNTTELAIPGATRIGDRGLNLHTKLLDADKDWRVPVKRTDQAFLDFEKTGPTIQARFFRPGDRFVPLGMTGRKKLKSFFIDEKIPLKLREAIPILTTGTGDIIWVYGKRISENFRITEKTRKILFIEGDRNCQLAPGE